VNALLGFSFHITVRSTGNEFFSNVVYETSGGDSLSTLSLPKTRSGPLHGERQRFDFITRPFDPNPTLLSVTQTDLMKKVDSSCQAATLVPSGVKLTIPASLSV